MRSWRSVAPLFAVLVLAVLWFLLSEPASHWLARALSRASYNGEVIGRVVHAEGQVRIVHGSDVTLVPSPTAKPVEFRDGDRLQTSVMSRGTLILNSQDEMNFGSGTVLQFQLWNPHDAGSPIYVQQILGDLELKKAGVRGKAYVVKDGRLYLPGQKPLQKPMALTVLKSAPLDLHLADSQAAADGEPAGDAEPPPASLNEPDTLSNEYIDSMIGERQGQIQKCWLSRLKDVPNLKGQMTLQFEITRRGHVKDLRMADSSVGDQTLERCVMSVFERINFREFKGAEITLSYPITFE